MKYRVWFDESNKPYGFTDGAIYEIVKSDGKNIYFKGYNHKFNIDKEIERLEEVEK